MIFWVSPRSAKTILKRPLPRMDWAMRALSSVMIFWGFVRMASISSQVMSSFCSHCCCRSSACLVQMICIVGIGVVLGSPVGVASILRDRTLIDIVTQLQV